MTVFVAVVVDFELVDFEIVVVVCYYYYCDCYSWIANSHSRSRSHFVVVANTAAFAVPASSPFGQPLSTLQRVSCAWPPPPALL